MSDPPPTIRIVDHASFKQVGELADYPRGHSDLLLLRRLD